MTIPDKLKIKMIYPPELNQPPEPKKLKRTACIKIYVEPYRKEYLESIAGKYGVSKYCYNKIFNESNEKIMNLLKQLLNSENLSIGTNIIPNKNNNLEKEYTEARKKAQVKKITTDQRSKIVKEIKEIMTQMNIKEFLDETPKEELDKERPKTDHLAFKEWYFEKHPEEKEKN